MAESIQRDGVWYNQQPDGSWLRWDETTRQWLPSPGPPSPAPPPSSAAPSAGAVTSPLPLPGTTQPLAATEPTHPPPAATPSPTPTPGSGQPLGGPASTASGYPPSYTPGAGTPSSTEVFAPGSGRGGLFANRAVLIVIAILLLGALAGAGIMFLGGDESVTSDPDGFEPPVPPIAEERAEFIAKADAICAQLNAASAALPQPQNRRQLIARVKKGLEISVAAIKKLRALDYPPEDRPVVRQLFALSDRGLALLQKGLRAARAGDQRAFLRATRRSLAVGQRFNQIATEYGFQECNKDA